jgi:hypothetical protein
VDQLTKVAHFIPIKTTYSGPQLTELYMLRIVYLHGVLKNIVFGRETQFTSKFREILHETIDKIVYVKDNLSARSAEEDCVW